MKKKGFTLVELLVVIAIIALLMSILMPALARARAIAYRMICGSNLSGIGKAMLVYANDADERFPVAGGRKAYWDMNGQIQDWDEKDWKDAFGAIPIADIPGSATVTSSHYLLVKYADVSPKQFVCRGDSGTTPFKLSDFALPGVVQDLTTVHDFGPAPSEHDSYTYHMPYTLEAEGYDTSYPVSMVHNPSAPVASDKNPFQDQNAENFILGYPNYVTLDSITVSVGGQSLTQYSFVDPYMDNDPPDNSPYGNSASHQREGQNVLYVDAHIVFEKHPNVGIENDNIWLRWRDGDVPSGSPKPTNAVDMQVGYIEGSPTPDGSGSLLSRPYGRDDAFLVNDTDNVVQ
jgi:prepilin-type N-terminal cleavage/methylation domain-containing protein